MAKVFIEETTLTAIGDAIRGKEGSTELVPVNDMATRISTLQTGSNPVIESLEITSNGTYTATDCDGYSPITVNVPQDGAPTAEDLTYTGTVRRAFASNMYNWLINKYGNQITLKDVTLMGEMFYESDKITHIPFDINFKSGLEFSNIFYACYGLEELPKFRGTLNLTSTSLNFNNMMWSCKNVRNLDDVFLPETIAGFSTIKVTSSYSAPRACNFTQMMSLRKIPAWWYEFRLNPESTAFPSSSYAIYYGLFSSCYVLDEVTNVPVWECQGAQTSNMLSSTLSHNHRLKNFTFETNEDGTPKTAKWKSQTFDLTNFVGNTNGLTAICSNNSGITKDKQVHNDETYQALKDDPDWFTIDFNYSRYDKISAINTINSLPDTSAYLATAGGTNTIKFKGSSGTKTDGGAINTMTAEEIAVATAKGWTVTFS